MALMQTPICDFGWKPPASRSRRRCRIDWMQFAARMAPSDVHLQPLPYVKAVIMIGDRCQAMQGEGIGVTAMPNDTELIGQIPSNI